MVAVTFLAGVPSLVSRRDAVVCVENLAGAWPSTVTVASLFLCSGVVRTVADQSWLGVQNYLEVGIFHVTD